MGEETKAGDQAMALELERYRAAEIESVRSQAVSAALGGYDLNPGAADQIAFLMKNEVQVVEDGGGRKVAIGPGFRPVGEVIKERLSKPEYAHFLRGGSLAPAGPQPRQEGEQLGSFLIRALTAEKAAMVGPDSNPATNLRLPFGIAPK
jgi:hypothetical protein